MFTIDETASLTDARDDNPGFLLESVLALWAAGKLRLRSEYSVVLN